MRTDTDRIDWLSRSSYVQIGLAVRAGKVVTEVRTKSTQRYFGSDLRRAIDAAMDCTKRMGKGYVPK